MKILYGTTNKAKLQAMKNALKDMDIQLIGLNDIENKLPVINESGNTPLENAQIKARAYYKAFGIPVFSCDSGLYFDEVADSDQPVLHIRRVNGIELTDEQMERMVEIVKRAYAKSLELGKLFVSSASALGDARPNVTRC